MSERLRLIEFEVARSKAVLDAASAPPLFNFNFVLAVLVGAVMAFHCGQTGSDVLTCCTTAVFPVGIVVNAVLSSRAAVARCAIQHAKTGQELIEAARIDEAARCEGAFEALDAVRQKVREESY